MRSLFVFAIFAALTAGCGKAPEDAHEGHDHGKSEASHGGHEQGKEGFEKQGPRAVNEEAASSAKTGPGLAVEAYEVEEGRLKLSEKAEKRLGVRSEKAALRHGVLRVPIQALGHEEGEPFLYVRDKEGWLKRTFVTVGPRSGNETQVLAGLVPGVEIVVQGASLVRLAELDILAGDTVASCCAI